jgi:hypothetical protein
MHILGRKLFEMTKSMYEDVCIHAMRTLQYSGTIVLAHTHVVTTTMTRTAQLTNLSYK